MENCIIFVFSLIINTENLKLPWKKKYLSGKPT